MLKVYDTAVTLAEFPDEIALCLNISNCPNQCEGCSESWLAEDIGTELSNELIKKLINDHSDCTVFGLLGGDSDHEDIKRIADYVHNNSNMKVGLYSGRDYIDIDLIDYIDLYKIGRWIKPKGTIEDIKSGYWGPLVWPNSNQLYFEKHDNMLVDATWKFKNKKINDYNKYII